MTAIFSVKSMGLCHIPVGVLPEAPIPNHLYVVSHLIFSHLIDPNIRTFSALNEHPCQNRKERVLDKRNYASCITNKALIAKMKLLIREY
jgi:hypothetical protein